MSQVKHNPSWMVTKLNQVAITHVYKNELANALLVLQKSLDICKTYTPAKYFVSREEYEHLQEEKKERALPSKFLIATLVSLGKVYLRDEKVELAREHFQKAEEAADRTYGSTDKRRLDVICESGAFYFEIKSYQKAKEKFFEVKELLISSRGPPGVYTKQHGLANYYTGMIELLENNPTQALKLTKQALVTYRTLYSPYDLRIANVIASLGEIYYVLEMYPEAREHVEYAGMIYTTKSIKDKLAHLEELHAKILQHIPGAKGLLPPLKLLKDNTFERLPFQANQIEQVMLREEQKANQIRSKTEL